MKVVVVGVLPQSLVNFRGPLLQTMVQRGHEVIACASGADDAIVGQLNEWGVTYHDVPIKRAGMNPIQDLATLWHLTRLFRKLRPDVMLGYTIKPVVWGMSAARFAGVSRRFAMIEGLGYAFMSDGSWRHRVIQRVACSLYKLALNKVDGIFFLNPDDVEEFRKRHLFGGNTRVIRIDGIGVDLDEFAPQPLPTEPVFLLIARLIADKGIREYRDAARIVRRKYPQTRFLLAGGLDDNPTSIGQKELNEWQVPGDIQYLGTLADVCSTLAESAVYVLPSYREGTPRTVLEAMATGRPVITTDAPGCRETVEDGVNGFLVPVKDVEALAGAMVKLVEQPGLRKEMGAESLRIAREKYDVHKVNAVILEAMGL